MTKPKRLMFAVLGPNPADIIEVELISEKQVITNAGTPTGFFNISAKRSDNGQLIDLDYTPIAATHSAALDLQQLEYSY
jgi:hypothetical protein